MGPALFRVDKEAETEIFYPLTAQQTVYSRDSNDYISLKSYCPVLSEWVKVRPFQATMYSVCLSYKSTGSSNYFLISFMSCQKCQTQSGTGPLK